MENDIQIVNKFKIRTVIHIKLIDVFAFLIIVSEIPVVTIDSFLPDYLKPSCVMTGFIFLCIYYIFMRKQIVEYVMLWMLYLVWLCFCNLINSRDLLSAIYYPSRVITFVVINKMYLDRYDKTLLKMTRHYLTILFLINFIIQLYDQERFGYTDAHNFINFFESDNYLGWYYVAYIALCIILDFIEKGKIKKITYAEIALCMASIVRAWVGKTLIALICIIIYVLFIYRKKIARIITPTVLCLGFIVLDIGIVFFSLQKIFSVTLFEFLGKDMTISGRIYIWAAAINNILKSPIWGYGVSRGGILSINLIFGKTMAAHNVFLEIAIQAGIVGVVIYILALLAFISKGTREYQNSSTAQMYQYEYLFLHFMIFMMFFMAIFSYPMYIPFFYLPMILLSSFESLVKMHEMNKPGMKVYDTGRNLLNGDEQDV